MNELLGCVVVVCVLGLIVGGYILHMWHILQDIAREDAEALAQEIADEIVRNTRYRVVIRQYIGCGKGYERHAGD